MITKEKALYQVKLILDCLPKDEYELIPQERIDYIENNMEYDENITIDPDMPLEKQKIDDKAYDILDKIIKEVEKNKKNVTNNQTDEIKEYVAKAKKENEQFDMQIENIRLKNIIEVLKNENTKIPKAKNLLEEYKIELDTKNKEIEKLNKNIELLNKEINKIPKFIRGMFIKDCSKLLSN